jgi:hypothetical protein
MFYGQFHLESQISGSVEDEWPRCCQGRRFEVIFSPHFRSTHYDSVQEEEEEEEDMFAATPSSVDQVR